MPERFAAINDYNFEAQAIESTNQVACVSGKPASKRSVFEHVVILDAFSGLVPDLACKFREAVNIVSCYLRGLPLLSSANSHQE